MSDRTKLRFFIRSLSDEEMRSQIADFSGFMAEYRLLLLEEHNIRTNGGPDGFVPRPTRADTARANTAQDDEESEQPEISLEYSVLEAIREKVAGFSEEELLNNLEELDRVLSNVPPEMPKRVYDEYLAAREACVLRYFDDYQREPVVCEKCGAYLVPIQAFCGKCGSCVLKPRA